MGVVSGPLRPTVLRSIESSSAWGSVVPWRSRAVTPASCRSHSISAPEAVRIRTTAADTSGPMPSPGMSVIVCAMPPLL